MGTNAFHHYDTSLNQPLPKKNPLYLSRYNDFLTNAMNDKYLREGLEGLHGGKTKSLLYSILEEKAQESGKNAAGLDSTIACMRAMLIL